MRKRGEKTRNGGQWTEARFHSFIVSALRSASTRWDPMHDCLKKARVSRGLYECASCGEHVPPTIKKEGERKRTKNIFADHIKPVVDPSKGFEGYDEYIKRMFVEVEGFQALCGECHTKKTNEERGIAKDRRENERNSG